MKKLALVISLLFSVCAFAQIDKVVPKRPTPPRLVNDFANLLTQDQIDALERKLVAYDDSTSNQIAIVILPTITANGEEYPIEDVGLKILRDWGVGNRKNNNGIVLLAAMEERKLRIEVGYGLEGVIPDITAKAIIDNDLRPNFRNQEYYRGFDAAINSIMEAARGEYKAPEGYRNRGAEKGVSIGKIIVGIIILIVILSMFGGGGSRGGGYMSRRGSGWLGPFILGDMLGRASRGGGFGGSGWSGGGGGWSGGGGGFGGFGGGSGGGGGASGGW
jgi:uncharacterized protein